MDISLGSLAPFEKLESDLTYVLDIVEKKGYAVLLKDNKPAYMLIKYTDGIALPAIKAEAKRSNYTLQEAMKIVLLEQTDQKMHAAKLADEIHERGLYYKKNGGKAQYNQIRARANNYPDLFEALPGNIIKLI